MAKISWNSYTFHNKLIGEIVGYANIKQSNFEPYIIKASTMLNDGSIQLLVGTKYDDASNQVLHILDKHCFHYTTQTANGEKVSDVVSNYCKHASLARLEQANNEKAVSDFHDPLNNAWIKLLRKNGEFDAKQYVSARANECSRVKEICQEKLSASRN